MDVVNEIEVLENDVKDCNEKCHDTCKLFCYI